MADLERLTAGIPDKAKKLIDKFWPGPLTVVLKKTHIVPDIVTTGLGTVAVRMPAGKVALKLIELSGTPIAAPSANLFGKPSPTLAAHVVSDLGAEVDMIIDGGETDIGIESTVVAFDGDEAVVLRPGGTTVEEIEEVIGKIKVLSFDANAMECPGKYPQHYSPDAEVILVSAGMDQTEKVRHLAEDLKKRGRRVGIMCVREHEGFYNGDGIKVLGPEDDPKICASNLSGYSGI
jgi:L-threonylcarbamoyladenylate synthase